ncbi:hypothetical protein Bbelb_222230 [Branchiostoma belcheri]|nr:hypothetical protein Bbelb_222230 [Branchiostoma belcheri]
MSVYMIRSDGRKTTRQVIKLSTVKQNPRARGNGSGRAGSAHSAVGIAGSSRQTSLPLPPLSVITSCSAGRSPKLSIIRPGTGVIKSILALRLPEMQTSIAQDQAGIPCH